MRAAMARKARGWGWACVAAVGLAVGCNDFEGSCDDLAEICATCPLDGDGPVAASSCNHTVDSGDEAACQARLDQDTYAICRAP